MGNGVGVLCATVETNDQRLGFGKSRHNKAIQSSIKRRCSGLIPSVDTECECRIKHQEQQTDTEITGQELLTSKRRSSCEISSAVVLSHVINGIGDLSLSKPSELQSNRPSLFTESATKATTDKPSKLFQIKLCRRLKDTAVQTEEYGDILINTDVRKLTATLTASPKLSQSISSDTDAVSEDKLDATENVAVKEVLRTVVSSGATEVVCDENEKEQTIKSELGTGPIETIPVKVDEEILRRVNQVLQETGAEMVVHGEDHTIETEKDDSFEYEKYLTTSQPNNQYIPFYLSNVKTMERQLPTAVSLNTEVARVIGDETVSHESLTEHTSPSKLEYSSQPVEVLTDPLEYNYIRRYSTNSDGNSARQSTSPRTKTDVGILVELCGEVLRQNSASVPPTIEDPVELSESNCLEKACQTMHQNTLSIHKTYMPAIVCEFTNNCKRGSTANVIQLAKSIPFVPQQSEEATTSCEVHGRTCEVSTAAPVGDLRSPPLKQNKPRASSIPASVNELSVNEPEVYRVDSYKRSKMDIWCSPYSFTEISHYKGDVSVQEKVSLRRPRFADAAIQTHPVLIVDVGTSYSEDLELPDHVDTEREGHISTPSVVDASFREPLSPTRFHVCSQAYMTDGKPEKVTVELTDFPQTPQPVDGYEALRDEPTSQEAACNGRCESPVRNVTPKNDTLSKVHLLDDEYINANAVEDNHVAQEGAGNVISLDECISVEFEERTCTIAEAPRIVTNELPSEAEFISAEE